eukprot:1314354-Rhodomonas_salina.1
MKPWQAMWPHWQWPWWRSSWIMPYAAVSSSNGCMSLCASTAHTGVPSTHHVAKRKFASPHVWLMNLAGVP